MTKRQADLFEFVRPRRRGRRVHPTPAMQEAVRALAQAGLSRSAIAIAVNISPSVLYAHYPDALGDLTNNGRPRHVPTPASRQQAKEMACAGRSRDEIAAALGVSPPTVARHYRTELQQSIATTASGQEEVTHERQ